MVEARYHLATLRGRSWGYLATKPSHVQPGTDARTSRAQSA
jgi:hypothetical protein